MNVLLMGGGMDSYAVLLWLMKSDIPVTCVHIDYGQTSSMAERKACKSQLDYVFNKFNKVPDFIEDDDFNLIHKLNPNGSYLFGNKEASPELKGRNLVLFLKAVGLAGYNGKIYMGLDKPYNGAEPFKDCVLSYFDKAIKLIDRPDIEVIAPFIKWDKKDVVYWASEQDGYFLDRTMSCWDAVVENGRIIECGVCKHCKTKQELRLGVYDGNSISH